jgi:hypothetical protein
MINFNLEITTLLNAQLTTSGGNSSELDISQYEGNIFLSVDDRAGGTAAATVTVQHAETSGGSFSAVPADALFNPQTGVAATFTDLGTAGSSEALGLVKNKLKRFIRVAVAGTTITHDLAIVAAAQEKYTEA